MTKPEFSGVDPLRVPEARRRIAAGPTYDLSFVAPHRRDEVLRRIRIVEEYLEQPSRAAAEKAAADMGVSIVTLYNLAKVWRAGRDPAALSGSGRPKRRRNQLSPAQHDVIAEACSAADGRIEPALQRARQIAKLRNVDLPATSAMRRHIREAFKGRLPAGSYAAAADVLVAHCAVDLPVENGSKPCMPIATMVVRITDAAVLGVALARERPCPAMTAKALARSMERKWTSHGDDPAVAMGMLEDERWGELSAILTSGGVRVLHRSSGGATNADLALALLGAWKDGVRILSRRGHVPFDRRPATLGRGAAAISLQEAEDTLRGRWESPVEPEVPQWQLHLAGQLMAFSRGFRS